MKLVLLTVVVMIATQITGPLWAVIIICLLAGMGAYSVAEVIELFVNGS